MARVFTASRWWATARQQGLVQGDAPQAQAGDAQEPGALVIALAMVGALACLVPLGAFLVMALGEKYLLGAGGILLGAVSLVGAAVLLRISRQAFVNAVALVLWCLGGALMVFQLADYLLDARPGVMVVCALVAGAQLLGAWLAQTRWIQALMGLGWAMALLGLLMVLESYVPWPLPLQWASLAMAALWWWWIETEQQRLAQPLQWWAQPRWAAFADAAAVGVLLTSLAQGMGWRYWVGLASHGVDRVMAALPWGQLWASAVVLVATVLLARTWHARHAAGRSTLYSVLLAGGLLAVGAWFGIGLELVAVIAAAALVGARWRIAAVCGVIALGLLAQFYYQATWSLAAKGLGLACVGAVLLLGLWLLRRAKQAAVAMPADQGHAHTTGGKTQLAWVIAGAVLVLGVVNWDVRGKEQVIAHGQRILVPLVPVDPRSLMQGDYMALNFDLPPSVREGLEKTLATTVRVRASVDAQGIATVLGSVADRYTPAAGEVVLPLKQLKGQWVLVTDAYFFPEGTGSVFESAKYGDFRVLPDGRALLVGLADKQGQVIEVPRAPITGQSEATEAVEGPVVDVEPETAAAVAPPVVESVAPPRLEPAKP